MTRAALLRLIVALSCVLTGSALQTVLAAQRASIQSWDVKSPDGRTSIVLSRHADGHLTYRVLRGRAVVIDESPLGIRRSDELFVDGLTFTRVSDPVAVNETYSTPYGKRQNHVVHGRERVVSFIARSGKPMDLVLRAHDDGVAFRYRFPNVDTIAKSVTEELTGFAVPAGSTAWIEPQQPVGQYAPAYEELYTEMPAGTAAPQADGWAFPALFKTNAGPWALITESGMDGNYCGSHLQQAATDGVYRLKFPDAGEGRGLGLAQPRSALAWTLPWRVVIVGDTAGHILESDLVLDLSPPTRMSDTSWIRPGRAAWSWWSESDSPKSAARLNAFTDLAADMGWEYTLIDANWNTMPQAALNDVLAHAKQKNVGVLLWYNSGGAHNNVTEAPRERMVDRLIRRGEMSKLRDWGVKGIKVDFWQSDKQDRMQQYRAVLQDAAEYHLMVDVHGSTIPRGWEREFPHLVGMEAVAGAEQYKFRRDYPENAAWQNTVLPFTRNAIGTMDFTPVTFSDAQYPHLTTNAHELALAVLFTTGVQHFADSVTAYTSLPEAPKTFLRQIPVVWDETRVVDGEPGRSITVARRSGPDWYVAGINANTARSARVPLAFLASGSWQMTLIADGVTDREFASRSGAVSAKDTIEVPMRARGGWVMVLRRP
ncbi:MAG: glycoside hydrolase family 97 catalytic domain-containing protein [Acidobacteriota bacterium]